MVSSCFFHDPEIVLPDLPDILKQYSPIRSHIPVQLVGLEQHIPKIISHLPQSVWKTLTLHERQNTCYNSANRAQDGNRDMRVDLIQRAQDDKSRRKYNLQGEKEVCQYVECAVLELIVLKFRMDR